MAGTQYKTPTGDFVTTSLNGALAAGATSATIGTGLNLAAANGVLQIDYDSSIAVGTDNGPETIFYTSYTSGTGALTGITRGISGTTDVAHANGASVHAGPSIVHLSERPISVDRQNDTTNANVTNQRICYGWGQVSAPADTNASETVTLPITFDDTPIVLINFAGQGASGDFTNKNISSNQYRGFGSANTIIASSFNAQLICTGGGNWNAAGATTLYYTWLAIGTKA